MTMKEHITLDPVEDRDAWMCICGNYPSSDGFYPCDKNGDEVNPTPEEWAAGLYVCGRCGRIINPSSLEVVGRATQPKLLA